MKILRSRIDQGGGLTGEEGRRGGGWRLRLGSGGGEVSGDEQEVDGGEEA